MPQGGAKDEHFSCFHNSCQWGLSVFWKKVCRFCVQLCLNCQKLMALSWNLTWMKNIKLFFRSQDVQFQMSIFVNFVIFCRFASLPKQWEEYLPEFFVDSPKNEDIYRGINDCRSSCCRMYVVIIFPPNVYRIIYFFLQTFQLEWQLRRFGVSELVDIKVNSQFF